MTMSIYALAASDIQANGIIIALGSIGFLVDDLSVLLSGANPPDHGACESPQLPVGKPASGSGGGGGPVIGGALGWITGISRLAIPGLGPFIAAGPIKALLNGSVLGQIDGDLAGPLIGLGLPATEAHRYESKVRDGRILIVAHSDKSAWMAKATQVLRDAGAEDIGRTHEEASPPGALNAGAAPPAAGAPTPASAALAPQGEARSANAFLPSG
jgi:hypothetical protein